MKGDTGGNNDGQSLMVDKNNGGSELTNFKMISIGGC